MNVLHMTAKPQKVYRAINVDWKPQNNREKRSFILDKSMNWKSRKTMQCW